MQEHPPLWLYNDDFEHNSARGRRTVGPIPKKAGQKSKNKV